MSAFDNTLCLSSFELLSPCSPRKVFGKFKIEGNRLHRSKMLLGDMQRKREFLSTDVFFFFSFLFFPFLPMSRASRDSRRSLVYSPVWDSRKEFTKIRRTLKWDQNLMFPLFPTMQLQHDS